MEESSTTAPLPVSKKPSKSQIELKQLNLWQNKLLPWLVIMPTLLILLFPFTRLIHMITVPVEYLWRSFQRVIWTRRKVA